MTKISKTAQLTKEAVSLIKMEKYDEALTFLKKAQLRVDIGSSKQKSPDNIVYDIDARPLEILDNFALRDSHVCFKFECDEGMRTFSEPIEMIIHEAADFDCHPIDQIILDAVVKYNLGIVMICLDRDDKAYRYFQKSLSLKQTYSSFVQNKGKFGFLEIAILHNLGHINYRSRHYEEALSKYRSAKHKLSKDSYDLTFGLLDKALSLNCVGIVAMHLSKGSGDGTEDCTSSPKH